MQHTTIIATPGPRVLEKKFVEHLISAGVTIFRINCSHASKKDYAEYVTHIRATARRMRREVFIMQDLQGPRIRVGNLPEDGITMRDGESYIFCYGKQKPGNGKKVTRIPITDPYLHLSVKKGEPLYLANGDIELKVTRVHNGCITAIVLDGGVLFSNKAINVPRTTLRQGRLTRKDITDVKNGLKHGTDFIALSFVQSAEDVLKLRRIIGGKKIKIIAKIERAVALRHIDEIIQASDGIMIARGDLGVEIPYEDVPIVQKNLVRHAHWHSKPAIIATQMLTSMIRRPLPTCAEVSDIANAVIDGGDALMLSDETAAGDHPIRAVTTMRRVITSTERFVRAGNLLRSTN